jgi:predicted ribosomally synthesized peptide with SipW-like signal peptide
LEVEKVKKIFGLTVAALLVIGLIGGGTWALFSDVETSEDNTFTAGTLDLTVDNQDDPSIVAIDIGPMPPGAAAAYNMWVVRNVGNIAGDLQLTVSAIDDQEGDNPESETNITGDGDLSGQLDVILFVDVNGNGAFDTGTDTELYGDGAEGMDLLSGMPGTYDPTDPGTSSADPVNITLRWQLPDLGATNNEIHGDISIFDIQFDLTQS